MNDTPDMPMKSRLGWHAPMWLQVAIIIALVAGAVLGALQGWYWASTLVGIGGVAFGISLMLRRMVGDEYGRS